VLVLLKIALRNLLAAVGATTALAPLLPRRRPLGHRVQLRPASEEAARGDAPVVAEQQASPE
jgi:hypothetical protein